MEPMQTEKLTINVTPVDLGKIDLVVSQGHFSTRADFIRTAIRKEISEHEPMIQDVVKRQYWSVGAEMLSRKDLEKARAKKQKMKIRVVGLLALAKDVTPDLAAETIESVKVLGVFRAHPEVLKRLQPRKAARASKE
jgi:Arc/MetJ-type ribon-helix-helix transcriptional regulator